VIDTRFCRLLDISCLPGLIQRRKNGIDPSNKGKTWRGGRREERTRRRRRQALRPIERRAVCRTGSNEESSGGEKE
jgi:hypothetical protein